MAEIKLYHGRADGKEPPTSLLSEAVETASASTPDPPFCVSEVVHHGQVENWRRDFGPETGGQSAICLCDPSDHSNVSVDEISAETIDAIEAELRDRLGAGLLAVIDITETYRIDDDGDPRALPVGLDPTV